MYMKYIYIYSRKKAQAYFYITGLHRSTLERTQTGRQYTAYTPQMIRSAQLLYI